MKVLIAEDSQVQRLQLELCLAEWGYEVEPAADGAAAWRMLKRPEPPRLAILDWVMPAPDGAELCRRIRASRRLRGTFVILLTAKGALGETAEVLQRGPDGFLRKPVDPLELLAGLRLGERVLRLQDKLAKRKRQLQEAQEEVQRLRTLLPGKE